MCVYLLQRSKADLCKSAHLSGTGTEKIHTELFFFSLTSFKVETGEDTQLPTRVSFLTRSLFVVCSNVFLLFYSGVGLESMNVLREKETGHFKNKTKKGNGERV